MKTGVIYIQSMKSTIALDELDTFLNHCASPDSATTGRVRCTLFCFLKTNGINSAQLTFPQGQKCSAYLSNLGRFW